MHHTTQAYMIIGEILAYILHKLFYLIFGLLILVFDVVYTLLRQVMGEYGEIYELPIDIWKISVKHRRYSDSAHAECNIFF